MPERMMEGLMMDVPLTLTPLLRRAARLFPDRELVTSTGEGMERSNYAEMAVRCGRLARALEGLGVERGDRVGTLAWNHTRHLELYFTIPCMGSVLHPLNIRLPLDQLAYIVNHAENKVVCVDPSLLPLAEKLAPKLDTVQHWVVLEDEVPDTPLTDGDAPVHAYEELIARADGEYGWPELDEDAAAAMCYTSGTTGHPKGVVYSHRSTVLHAFALCLPDAIGFSQRDVVLPVVPMFHAMAWGSPFACTMLGCKQVFPGPHLQPRELARLLEAERVTVTAGVPTLWTGLLHLLDEQEFDLSHLRTLVVGGSAAPRSMIEGFERRQGLRIVHAWGMTETSPLGTVSRLKCDPAELSDERRFDLLATQGLPVPGIEARAVDDEGREIPWNGEAFGELQVRGPWVASAYYRDERSSESFQGGWFRTGDVVTLDPEGYIQIVDRTKDLIKSGGEWISSQELENALMAHPGVMEAAVIAVPHPKWQERPLACVVPRPGLAEPPDREELLAHLRPDFPKMYLPDDIVFLDEIPKTSVGKFDKKVLRSRFEDHELPDRES